MFFLMASLKLAAVGVGAYLIADNVPDGSPFLVALGAIIVYAAVSLQITVARSRSRRGSRR